MHVADFPLAVDCKAYARFSHHKLMEAIQRKYAGIPCLVTKHERQVGAYVTVPLFYFAQLLDRLRAAEHRDSA